MKTKSLLTQMRFKPTTFQLAFRNAKRYSTGTDEETILNRNPAYDKETNLKPNPASFVVDIFAHPSAKLHLNFLSIRRGQIGFKIEARTAPLT